MFLFMEVLKTGEHRKHQPCTLNETACCSRLCCGLPCWGLCQLLSRINHAPTRKFCESVYKNKSVKVTRSEMQLYLLCHTTWRILTGCVVVAEVVTPHPVRCFAGQSSAGLLRICSYRPPTLLQYFQHPCRGNHTSESTLGYTCNLSCELFRIQNGYCDLRVCGAFL